MTIKRYAGDRFTGLSTDGFPNVADGAFFTQTDTKQIYLKIGGSWEEVGGMGSLAISGANDYLAKYDLALSSSIFNYYGAEIFETFDRIDLINSTGTYNVFLYNYEMDIGETFLSLNLYDSDFGLTNINSAGIIVDTSGSVVVPLFYLSNNGGNDWTECNNNSFVSFATSGTDLRLKSVATSGAAILEEYAVFYQSSNETSTISIPRNQSFYYEGQAIVDDTIITGFIFGKRILLTGGKIFARTAPTGSDFIINILKNSVPTTESLTLSAGNTYQFTAIENYGFTADDYLGLKISAPGSVSPAEGITITLEYVEISPEVVITEDWEASMEVRMANAENVEVLLDSRVTTLEAQTQTNAGMVLYLYNIAGGF